MSGRRREGIEILFNLPCDICPITQKWDKMIVHLSRVRAKQLILIKSFVVKEWFHVHWQHAPLFLSMPIAVVLDWNRTLLSFQMMPSPSSGSERTCCVWNPAESLPHGLLICCGTLGSWNLNTDWHLPHKALRNPRMVYALVLTHDEESMKGLSHHWSQSVQTVISW